MSLAENDVGDNADVCNNAAELNFVRVSAKGIFNSFAQFVTAEIAFFKYNYVRVKVFFKNFKFAKKSVTFRAFYTVFNRQEYAFACGKIVRSVGVLCKNNKVIVFQGIYNKSIYIACDVFALIKPQRTVYKIVLIINYNKYLPISFD